MLSKLNDPDFDLIFTNHDIVCICETFITSLNDIPPHFFNKFHKYIAPASKLSNQGRPSGGVIVLIKTTLDVVITEIRVHIDNIIALKLSDILLSPDGVKDLILVSTYIPPCGSTYYSYKSPHEPNGIHLLENVLFDLVLENDNSCMLICGDLNARTLNVQPCIDIDIDKYINNDPCNSQFTDSYDDNLVRFSEDKDQNSFGKSLLSLCSSFNLVIMNGIQQCPDSGSFTNISCHGSSVVDYFLLSHDLINNSLNMSIMDVTLSSHMAIRFLLPTNNNINTPTNVTVNAKPVTKYKWEPDKANAFKNALQTESNVNKLRDCIVNINIDFENSVSTFNNILLESASCMKKVYLKQGSYTTTRSKWFDEECLIKKKEVRRYLYKHKHNKNNQTRADFVKIRTEYKKLIKEKRKHFSKYKVKKIVSHLKQNNNSFWSEIKNISTKEHVQNNINLDTWFTYFKNFFQHAQNDPPICFEECELYNNILTGDVYNELLKNNDICLDEVKQAFNKVKPGKAVGVDQVSNEMLKCSDTLIIPFMHAMFKYLFTNGVFPDNWSTSIIVPIFKKGDPNACMNYRPISLTSLVSKLYTHILNARLSLYIDYNNIICKEQIGYREGFSPAEHLFTLYACVKKQFFKNRKLYAAFVDYKLCFDSVSRTGLFHVLTNNGIDGKLFNAIKSIYRNVQACVKHNDDLSQLFECPFSLRQGCLCSPKLFLIFVNELSIALNKQGKHGIQFSPGDECIFHLLFADDSLLISDTATGLQNQIDILDQQSNRLGLKVNLEKTKIIVFRKGGYLSKYEHWHYRNNAIEVVNSYKYLGLDVTTMFSHNSCTTSFISKAKKACFEIMKSLRSINCMDFDVFIKLFDTKVKPILLYGSELWGLKDIEGIEKVHLFALKRFLNVSLHCSNDRIYAETGRYPLFVCSKLRAIKFWFKLLKWPKERHSRSGYDMLTNLDSNARHSWVSDIKQLLFSNGYGHVWLFQQAGCENRFLKQFKQTLVDCYKQSWHDKISHSDQNEFYYSFKDVIAKERYLTSQFLPKVFRDVLLKFRLGVSAINCHRYRFDNNITRRYCPFCSVHMETEMHVIFVCKAYDDLRTKLPEQIVSSPNVRSLLTLLSSDEYVYCLSKYLYYVFKRRSVLLNNFVF